MPLFSASFCKIRTMLKQTHRCSNAHSNLIFPLTYASNQIFIVDYRNHSTENITQPDLVDTKGPALLAINNKTFSSADWHHIILIQDSSKRLDTSWVLLVYSHSHSTEGFHSKIGKYGLGFRSCYHVGTAINWHSNIPCLKLRPYLGYR